MKYLESFSSIIPALQGNKAIRRVEKLREIGEIQSEQEYSDRLGEILAELSGDTFEPSFNYIPFSPGTSSSDQYNQMLDQIRDDLEVAFMEVNNVYATIKAHGLLFKDKVISELYGAIEELEKETDKLLVVADPNNSFGDVEINTFAGDLFRMSSSEQYAREVLYDRREDAPHMAIDNAYVDIEEELMGLPLSRETEISFSQIQVINTQTTGSDYNVQLVDSDINSILEGGDSAGWIYNILKTDSLLGGSKLVLDADLGDKRLVNYLLIKPISDFPCVIDEILYINENDQEVVLPETSYFGTALSDIVKISFDDIVAKKFILKFSQRSSSLFNYSSSANSMSLDDLRRNTSLAANAQLFKDQLEQQLNNIDLLGVLPITATPSPDFQVVYQYTFGFTEISTGLTAYRNKGYFASRAYNKPSVGLIALETLETNTEYFDETANISARVGSFEYDIIKKDYNERGELIDSKEFPVLPIGQTSVPNERLPFSASRTTVSLRFIGHKLNGSGDDIKIFRNNIELLRGADWTFTDRDDTLDQSDPNLKPGLSSTRITILHSGDVIRNGIYTCSYTPRHIAEANDIITSRDIIYLNTNVTEHSIKKGAETIDNSDLFLKITIRNNSFYGNKTPKLDYYRLFTTSVDSGRFVRL